MDVNRFTDKSKQALMASQEIARRYQHTQVDVEHLLLGLLEAEDRLTLQIIERAGGDAVGVRRDVEAALARGPKVEVKGGGTGQLYVTPALADVLQRTAWEQAQ